MTHAWTASEVWELVKDWPEEAKPHGGNAIGYEVDGGIWDYQDGIPIGPESAFALHVASGIEWMAAVDVVEVQLGHEEDWLLCRWRDVDGNSRIVGQHAGPTLLHAIAAAIRATKGETR